MVSISGEPIPLWKIVRGRWAMSLFRSSDQIGEGIVPGEGKYQLIRQIGEGEFAEVWEGEQLAIGRQVAIKFLKGLERIRDKALLVAQIEESRLEAENLAKLDQANIIKIFDFGIEIKLTPTERTLAPYLVMEYAPNGTIYDKYEKLHRDHDGEQLPIELVVFYVQCVASGLQEAHNKGIIHRDIKPRNLLINKRNKVLIGDFGLAITEVMLAQTLPRPTAYPAYMAPEQLDGQPSAKSDQFSLAALAYEWLTGALPFENGDFSQPPTPITILNPQITTLVEAVVLRALAIKPEDRFDSVQNFATDLENAWLRRSFQAMDWLREADALSQKERYEEALRSYQQAINRDPALLAAHAGKGKALYHLRRYQEALLAYNEAVGTNPSLGYATKAHYARAYVGKGDTLLQLGRIEEALQAYKQALKEDATLAEALIGKGNAKWRFRAYGETPQKRQQRLDAAMKAFDDAMRHTPPRAVLAAAHCGRGTIHYTRGEYKEALKAYTLAIEQKPDFAEAHQRKGDTLRKLRRQKEIINGQGILPGSICAAYEEAIRLAPAALDAMNSLGDFLYELQKYQQAAAHFRNVSRATAASASDYCARGYALLRLGEPGEALISYEKALEVNVNDSEAYLGKGNALFDLGRHAEAQTAYDRAIALDPFSAGAHCYLGYVLRVLGEKPGVHKDDRMNYQQQALNAYRQAISLDEHLAAAYIGRGDIHCEQKDFSHALEDYELAISHDPFAFIPEARNGIGYVYAEQNRFTDAEAAYAALIEDLSQLEDPTDKFNDAPHLRVELSKAYYNRGNLLRKKAYLIPAACNDFEKAISYKEDFADAHNGLGKAHFQSKKHLQALLAYERAVHWEPTSPELHTNRGIALIYLTRYDEAFSTFEWVTLHLDSGYIDAYLGIGEMWEHKCDNSHWWQRKIKRAYLEEASKAYKLAIDRDKQNIDARKRRASVLNRLGKHEEARLEYGY